MHGESSAYGPCDSVAHVLLLPLYHHQLSLVAPLYLGPGQIQNHEDRTLLVLQGVHEVLLIAKSKLASVCSPIEIVTKVMGEWEGEGEGCYGDFSQSPLSLQKINIKDVRAC